MTTTTDEYCPPPGDDPPLKAQPMRLADHLYGSYAVQLIESTRFLESVVGDTLSSTETFGVEMSSLSFIAATLAIIKDVTGTLPTSRALFPGHVINTVAGSVILQISYASQRDPSRETRGFFTVEIIGLVDVVLQIQKALKAKFGDSRLATISWWFQSDSRSQVRSVVLQPPEPVYDEFYPYLGEPVDAFIDRYMQSSASILFMMGEPGTGKTSLVRHLIYSRRLNTTMTYDADLLQKDQMFVDFLTSDEDGILVIEDADTMLGSRDNENNAMISRFLNVSDGILKITGKKIIFTTNLGDFKKVDPALVRPGRCFGAVKFRALSPSEARAAAVVAGLDPPETDGAVTLAELFNRNSTMPDLVQIGF